VDVSHVVGGIGERPAVVHLRRWQLAGYTTGSGTLAPHLTVALLEACERGDYERTEALRRKVFPAKRWETPHG
jgi:dihydrodipicolinate synthase/N-acetylneuraminate lyase